MAELVPPGFIKGHSLRKWHELTKKPRKGVNFDLLVAYCAAYGRWQEAEDWLADGGDVDRSVCTIWDDKGNIRSHGPSPQVKISREAVKDMQRLGQELGL